MPPDAWHAMRTALERGPGHCPPDLFRDPVPQVVLGLKAYANNIAAARVRALEESFPRTHALVGDEAFGAACMRHLASMDVLARPLNCIGEGFERLWSGPRRDLAAAEWAWLRAHGAADMPALALADLAGLCEAALTALRVGTHPAAWLEVLTAAPAFTWDTVVGGSGSCLLITRSEATVILTRVPEGAAELWDLLAPVATLGDLLARDPAVTTVLIQTGALIARAGEA